jgi:hypothetical protein
MLLFFWFIRYSPVQMTVPQYGCIIYSRPTFGSQTAKQLPQNNDSTTGDYFHSMADSVNSVNDLYMNDNAQRDIGNQTL